jgi:hypothetical protein
VPPSCIARKIGTNRSFSEIPFIPNWHCPAVLDSSPSELSTYILSSTSTGMPLVTLWTASYCPSCHNISLLINSLISSGAGESEGGMAFCEVDLDAPDVMDSGVGMCYMITSLPTLLSFDRGEVMEESRVADVRSLRNKEKMREWIEREARRGSRITGGGGGRLFGGLFGNAR